MKYFEDAGSFVYELTQDETNKLFEPVDTSTNLNMRDFKNRFRFLRISYENMLTCLVGKQHDKWGYRVLDPQDGTMEIYFTEKRGAMVFKLLGVL